MSFEKQDDKFSIDAELILVNQLSKDKTEILSKMVGLLQEQGYVKETYYSSLLEREKVFPTGLLTQITGVAIPHTDSSHVNRPAIAVATLSDPVQFKAMDNPDKDVPVEIVIMMAIKEPETQLKTLQKVMGILQNNLLLKRLLTAQSSGEILAVVRDHLSS